MQQPSLECYSSRPIEVEHNSIYQWLLPLSTYLLGSYFLEFFSMLAPHPQAKI